MENEIESRAFYLRREDEEWSGEINLRIHLFCSVFWDEREAAVSPESRAIHPRSAGASPADLSAALSPPATGLRYQWSFPIFYPAPWFIDPRYATAPLQLSATAPSGPEIRNRSRRFTRPFALFIARPAAAPTKAFHSSSRALRLEEDYRFEIRDLRVELTGFASFLNLAKKDRRGSSSMRSNERNFENGASTIFYKFKN